MTPIEREGQRVLDAEALEQIAKRLADTLYYASGAIRDAHSRSAERFIRHDDYDRLREIAVRLRGVR